MPKFLSTALAAGSLLALATSLIAQSAVTSSDAQSPTYVQIEDDTMLVGPFNVTVDDLDEFDVIDATGHKIGEIEEVLADASGAPVAVVVVTEGLPDIEDGDFIVSLDRLQLVDAVLQIDMTREELSASPKWGD